MDVLATELQAKVTEYQQVIREQMAHIETLRGEIDRLRAENERLRADADAHGVLKSIYLDPDLPETTRIKAASAALPHEKPKLLSVVSGGPDRQERWRAYEQWQLKLEILRKTYQLPARGSGWDAHLVSGVYEAPPGDAEPPMDLYGADKFKAFIITSELMDAGQRILRDQRLAGADKGQDENSNQ
jgi:hypothetical protein